MSTPVWPERVPTVWRLLLPLALLRVGLVLAFAGRYGIFRDEYYYLACASRPALGYVDHPGLSVWILGLWRGAFGDSMLALRIPPALLGGALVILVGMLAAEMGGRWRAQLLAAVAVFFGMSQLVISSFYSMNSFEFVFWAASYLLVLRALRTPTPRSWLVFGLVLGVSLLNKISPLVFGAALAVGLLIEPHRAQLRRREVWAAAALALLFLLPYLLWNLGHEWATREFVENAKRYKITAMSPLAFLGEAMLEANPVVAGVWLAGLSWLLVAKRARALRVVAWIFLGALAIFLAQKSKPYYLGPAFLGLLAAGGVAWEQWTRAERWRWVVPALVAVIVVGSVPLLPIALPFFGPADTVAHMQRLGIAPAASEVGHTAELPQYLSDRLGWEEEARMLSAAYREVPEEDRANCVVIAANYGHAGALEYWSREYELPPVYSGHNNYWFWGPPQEKMKIVFTIGIRLELLQELELFDSIEEIGLREHPWAQESRVPIYLCRGLRTGREELWTLTRTFI